MIKVGDVVRIKEKNHNSFYFSKNFVSYGIITSISKGYSSDTLFWVNIVYPESVSVEDIRYSFYKEDVKKVKLHKLPREVYNALMIELLD